MKDNVNHVQLVLIVSSMIVYLDHALRVIFAQRKLLNQLHAGKEPIIQILVRVIHQTVFHAQKDPTVMYVVSQTMRIIFAQ